MANCKYVFSRRIPGMGRRGPQPKGEYGGKIGRTAVLSTRLQPDTRRRLVAATETSGRSLSQDWNTGFAGPSSKTIRPSSSMVASRTLLS